MLDILGKGNLIENLEFLQDNKLQRTIVVGILLKKVGQQVKDSISIVDLLSPKFPIKLP